MTKPVSLNAFKKRKRRDDARGKTLCGRGFHKWTFSPRKQFDVTQGKLVSVQVCDRCGETRNHVQ